MIRKVGVGAFRSGPCGLRDCVLTVMQMSPSVVRVYAGSQKTSLFAKVARWRLEDPEGFARLRASLQVTGGAS